MKLIENAGFNFQCWQFRRFWQSAAKIKETSSNNVSSGYVVGGCLLVEQLRSSGAKSGLLHLLARGVGCRMYALHFELEVVWIAGVLQRGFIADQALRVQIVEGLVERLHTVLGGAGANGLMNQARLFRDHDALADKRGRDQDLGSWDAACTVSPLNKSLADDGPQSGAKLHTHLLLLRWRKYSDDTVDGFDC